MKSLSANAEEFVPTNILNNQQQHQQQSFNHHHHPSTHQPHHHHHHPPHPIQQPHQQFSYQNVPPYPPLPHYMNPHADQALQYQNYFLAQTQYPPFQPMQIPPPQPPPPPLHPPTGYRHYPSPPPPPLPNTIPLNHPNYLQQFPLVIHPQQLPPPTTNPILSPPLLSHPQQSMHNNNNRSQRQKTTTSNNNNNYQQKFQKQTKQKPVTTQTTTTTPPPSTNNSDTRTSKEGKKSIKSTNKIKLNGDKIDESYGASTNVTFNYNENDFPSLNNNNSNDDETTTTTKTTIIEKEPPSELSKTDEENKKRMIKNINFIKAQVESHYNYQNKIDYHNLNEQIETKLSFKDVLEKKHERKNSPQISSASSRIKNNNESNAEEKNESNKNNNNNKQMSNDETKDVKSDNNNNNNSSGTHKKRRKRRKKKADTDNEKKKLGDETQSNDEFQLKDEDFPDLNDIQNENVKKQNEIQTQSSDLVNTETTEKKETNKPEATTANANKEVKNESSSSKKTKTPITIEFANVISALEKGIQDDKRNSKKSRSLKQNAEVTSDASAVNPLDSNPSGKRGKEREKPKNKKPSTLKKIILREREEKRKSRQIKQELSKLNIPSSPNANNQNSETKLDEQNEGKSTNSNSQSDSGSSNKDEKNEESKLLAEGSDTIAIGASEDYPTSAQMSPISQGSPISIGGYTPIASPYNVINNEELLTPEKLTQQVKEKIHSRKFREYCNQIINKEIDAVCNALLQDIVRFQDRLYHKNPTKAKMRRRYVMGIREVTKHLKLKKIKCIILAPNCEKIQSKGGLDEAINRIIECSLDQNVPFVFALGRKGLGRAVNKLVPISVVGIFDYSGAEQHFKKLVELAENAKCAYNLMVNEYEKEERQALFKIQQNPGYHLQHHHPQYALHHINNIQPTIPCHFGHSRTPSNGSNISIDPLLINYVTHAAHATHQRTPSGNFIIANITTGGGGHSRSASGTLSVDLNTGVLLPFHKHMAHSRTASNCSNISFVSRVSEPISEVNVPVSASLTMACYSTTNNNCTNTTTIAAVEYYSEQVRSEMRECDYNDDNLKYQQKQQIQQQQQHHHQQQQPQNKEDNYNEDEDDEASSISTTCGPHDSQQDKGENSCNNNDENDDDDDGDEENNSDCETIVNNIDNDANITIFSRLTAAANLNMHLSCIHEIDAGTEADVDEDADYTDQQQQQQPQPKQNRANSNSSTKVSSSNDSNESNKTSNLAANSDK